MTFRTDVDPEEGTRPLLLIGLTAVFVAVLLIVSGGEDEGKARASPRGRPATGGYVPIVPGAPVDGITGSPIKDAPPVTIIDDVRETLHRLPLDRNNPPDVPPPPKRKPG